MDTHHITVAPFFKLKDYEDKPRTRASQFLTIVTLEGAWMLWKVRCKRILGNNQQEDNRISCTETINTLSAALKDGLQEDITLTNAKKYGKKALERDLVISTWEDTLMIGRSKFKDWPYDIKVLVGIPDPPGQASPTHGPASEMNHA